jgi:hypothetical protein
MDAMVCQNSISERRPLPILLVQEIRHKLPKLVINGFPTFQRAICSTRKATLTPGHSSKSVPRKH